MTSKNIDEILKELSNDNRKLREENAKAQAQGKIEILDYCISFIEHIAMLSENESMFRKIIKELYRKRLAIIMEYSENEKVINKEK